MAACARAIADRSLYFGHPRKRAISMLRRYLHGNVSASNSISQWSQAVSEAEKVVGYSTSLLSLRYLLNDDVTNIALHLRRLVGSGHPILKTGKKLVSDSRSQANPRSLIVLLVSKAGNAECKEKEERGISRRQRSLAEITEMLYTFRAIHSGLIDEGDSSEISTSDVNLGNKISILAGDFILATVSDRLAKLQNTKVVELMAKTIGDMSMSSLLQNEENLADRINEGIPGWERRTYLSSASLLDRSCQAALELAELHPRLTKTGSAFGKEIGNAWQARHEIMQMMNHVQPMLDLLSAPVIFYLQRNQNSMDEIQRCKDDKDFCEKFRTDVLTSNAIPRTKDLCKQYCDSANDRLDVFNDSEAKTALKNIIGAINRSL
ncbi:PDSS2 (predicted) [Pycnogonum litorale]